MEHLNQYMPNGYQTDLNQFVSFLNTRGIEPTDVTSTVVKEYIYYLKKKNIKDATINRKLSVLRKYFKQLRINKAMTHNPFEEIKQLKIYNQKENVSIEKVEDVMKNIQSERDLLIFELMLYENITPKEMIDIKWECIDWNTGIIKLPNKMFALSKECINKLTQLKKVKSSDAVYVITNNRENQLKLSGVYFVLQKHLDKIGHNIKPKDIIDLKKNK